ncbi:MAG: hypothetical protein BroJett018_50430 [Chloroflexota bacterium]|nr:MAG: hypothetical protein BroJett018_50430 [Chloroflexota bacterium]
MLRLLQVMAGLSGVCLVVIYGTLATSDRDKSMPIALLDVSDHNLGHTLYSYVPSDDRSHLVTPRLDYLRIFDVSPDGLWAYVYATPDFEHGWPLSGVYKVRLDGGVYRFYTDGAGGVETIRSPDGQWLIYSHWEGIPEQQVLVRLRLQDGYKQILTELPAAFSPGEIMFSPDGDWIAYSMMVLVENSDVAANIDLFVLDVATGQTHDLTSGKTEFARVRWWTTGDEWLLYEGNDTSDPAGNGYFAIRPDGTEAQLALPKYAELLNIFAWIDDARLLLIAKQDYEFSAFRIGQPTPVWTVRGYPAITPDERTLIFQDVGDGRTLWRMSIEGGTPQKITTLPPMDLGLEISPDGKWVMVAAFVDGLSETQLLRVDLRDGTTRTIFTQTEAAVPDFAWSPDSQWISVYDGDGGNYWDEALVIMRADGNDRRRLEFSQGRPAVSWFEGEPADPIDRVLVGIGIGLIVGAFGLGWVRSKRA